MAFKLPEKKPATPDDPEALFRDLRKKTVAGLLSHQADVLRSPATLEVRMGRV